MYDALLSLCDYFNCAVLLARVAHNCVMVVKAADEPDVEDGGHGWYATWHCFLLALRLGLQRLKEECVPLLAQYCLRWSSRLGSMEQCALTSEQGYTV